MAVSADILISILLLVQIAHGVGEEEKGSSLIIQFHRGELKIEANAIPLALILDEIKNQCGVTVMGLEGRGQDLIRYTSQYGVVEREIEKLLNHLGEENYVLEFMDNRLARVHVLPKGEDNTLSSDAPLGAVQPQEVEYISAIRVVGIVEGSQALRLNIREGDLVVEYHGIRINRTEDLIIETKSSASDDLIKMILVREGDPHQILLSGGFIGIRIKDVRVAPEELVKYHSWFKQ